MGDLLVPLYRLERFPSPPPGGFTVRRPFASERRIVVDWVLEEFGEGWAGEIERTFSGQPVSSFVAVGKESTLAGFACYDASWKGFFGPTGVGETFRSRGLGESLLRRTLTAMGEAGYAYAVIGASGADAFYREKVGAIPIPDSEPGPYSGKIRR